MEFEHPEIIRPPSEHDSYFLALTSGCSNNTCSFCVRYYGKKLRIRPLEDVKKEIDAMSLYMNHGMTVPTMPPIVYAILHGWDGRRVFLQDGDILRRSVDELKALKDRKMTIIYMGIESGDDEVLKAICKNATHSEMVEAGRKVKEAGITLSVTIILGLAGIEGSKKHALETARVLSEIDPEFAGALTLTLVPGAPMYDQWEKGEFSMVSSFDSLRELKMIIENTNCTNCFFSSMHASNYFSVRGILPDDKERMVRELDAILAKNNPALLRPEFLRGM
ncbi:MAG: radical SAM protein [Dehalococcoidia bacterium]